MIIDRNPNGAFVVVDDGLLLDCQDVDACNSQAVHTLREIRVIVNIELEPALLEGSPSLGILKVKDRCSLRLPEGQLRGDVSRHNDSFESPI